MNAKLLIAVIACFFITACTKDQYTTKPQLEFKSLNGEAFPKQSNLFFKFTVTDKEGDIQDTMWVQKISFSCREGEFLTGYRMPVFSSTKNLKVELDVNYTYGELAGTYPIITGCVQRDDSCYFKFWIKDLAGNVSDTVTSPTIKLLKD